MIAFCTIVAGIGCLSVALLLWDAERVECSCDCDCIVEPKRLVYTGIVRGGQTYWIFFDPDAPLAAIAAAQDWVENPDLDFNVADFYCVCKGVRRAVETS